MIFYSITMGIFICINIHVLYKRRIFIAYPCTAGIKLNRDPVGHDNLNLATEAKMLRFKL
jgi:hypothetical protein